MSTAPDPESLLRRLVANQVEFVIVGGYAAVAYGVTLVTQDMDICCRFDAANLMRLQQALAGLHPVHRLTPARLPLSLAPEASIGLKNLYLQTDWGPLDCLGEIGGLGPYDTVMGHSTEIELEFGRCRILTIDALIRAKQFMDRPRDREAVMQLNAIAERLGLGGQT